MTVYRAAVAARDGLLSPVYADLSSSASHLWLALAAHADTHGECWPSVERLAAVMHCGPRTVQRARRELFAAGAIRVFLSPGGSTHTNTYRLPMKSREPRPQPCHPRQGSSSTTLSRATHPSANGVMGDARTMSLVTPEVAKEVEGEKRSAPPKRRRGISTRHHARRGAA